MQNEAKQQAKVSEIYRRLMLKTTEVIKGFKKMNKAKAVEDITSLIHLNIGPSKWF